MKSKDCGDILKKMQEDLSNQNTMIYVDDVMLNREGKLRVSKIAEEAANLLRQMKVPITSIYSDPQYFQKENTEVSIS